MRTALDQIAAPMPVNEFPLDATPLSKMANPMTFVIAITDAPPSEQLTARIRSMVRSLKDNSLVC